MVGAPAAGEVDEAGDDRQNARRYIGSICSADTVTDVTDVTDMTDIDADAPISRTPVRHQPRPA
jgi:hypothetical protein